MDFLQFSSILNKYVDYVKQYYKSCATIVFDGYPNHLTKSTKSAERYRRARRYEAANVLFDEKMCATMSQERFLSNDANKQRLIYTFLYLFYKKSLKMKILL